MSWPARLLRGCGIAGDPDPRGDRLRCARILGRLDLDYVTTAVPLVLSDCLLDHRTDVADIALIRHMLTRRALLRPAARRLVAVPFPRARDAGQRGRRRGS